MRILIWHVHGSWTTAFVQGRHEYLLPVTPGRDADGLGRARTWDWPASVRELPPAALHDDPVCKHRAAYWVALGIVDPNQIELAVLNLAINALQAMPETGGGKE